MIPPPIPSDRPGPQTSAGIQQVLSFWSGGGSLSAGDGDRPFGGRKFRFRESAEIDLIIERPGEKTVLLEIKSSTSVPDTVIHKLQSFHKDFQNAEALIFCRETLPRKNGPVTIFPWSQGLSSLRL